MNTAAEIRIVSKITVLMDIVETSNSSNQNFDFIPIHPIVSKFWMADVIIISIAAPISLYLLVALLYFHHKTTKGEFKNFFLTSSERKHRLLCIYICISIGFLLTVRHAYSIGFLIVKGLLLFCNLLIPQNDLDVVCNVLSRLDMTIYFIIIILVMLCLWFKQRTFYVHSHFQKNFKECRLCSYTVLIIYIVSNIALLIYFMYEVQYRYVGGFCFSIIKSYIIKYNFAFSMAFSILGFMSSFLIPLIFLLLFICPIIKLRSQQSREVQQSDQTDCLKRKMIKAICLAAFCWVTDIVTCLLLIFVLPAFYVIDINVIINLLAIIACFDCWKKLLWPWNTKSHRNDLVDEELYPMTVLSLDTRTITDPGAHTSIREPRSSPFS